MAYGIQCPLSLPQSVKISLMNTLKYQIPLSNGVTITATVTNLTSTVDNWISEVRSAAVCIPSKLTGAIVVGLACRKSRDSANEKAATLQLCWKDKVLVVQLHRLGGDCFKSIINAFNNSGFIFAAADVGGFAELRSRYELAFPTEVDIMSLPVPPPPSGVVGDGSYGKPHEGLARRLLGVKVDRPSHVVKSNWEATLLTFDQVKDVCIDAYLAYKLGDFIFAGP